MKKQDQDRLDALDASGKGFYATQKQLSTQQKQGVNQADQPKYIHSTEFIERSGNVHFDSVTGNHKTGSQAVLNQTQNAIVSEQAQLMIANASRSDNQNRIPTHKNAPNTQEVGSSRKLQQQIQIKNTRFHQQRKSSLQNNQPIPNVSMSQGQPQMQMMVQHAQPDISGQHRSSSINQNPGALAKSSQLLSSQQNAGDSVNLQNHAPQQIGSVEGNGTTQSQKRIQNRPGSKSMNRAQQNNSNSQAAANAAKLGKTFFHPPTNGLTNDGSQTALKARANSQQKFAGGNKKSSIGSQGQNDILYNSQIQAEKMAKAQSSYNRTSSLPNYANSGQYIQAGSSQIVPPNLSNVLQQKQQKFNNQSAVHGVAGMRQYASSIDRVTAAAMQNMNNPPVSQTMLIPPNTHKERKRSQQLHLNQNLQAQQSPNTVQANRQQKMLNHQQQQVATNYQQQSNIQKANRKAFRATQQFGNMAKVSGVNHSSVNVQQQFVQKKNQTQLAPNQGFNSTQNIRFTGSGNTDSALSLQQQQILASGQTKPQQLLLNEHSAGDLNTPGGDYEQHQSKSVQRDHGHRRHLQQPNTAESQQLFSNQQPGKMTAVFHNQGNQKQKNSWSGKGQGNQNGRSSSLGPATGKSTGTNGSLSTATKKKSGDYFSGQHQSHQLSSASQIEQFPRGGSQGLPPNQSLQHTQPMASNKFVVFDGASQGFHSNKDFMSGGQSQGKHTNYNQQLMAAYQAVQAGSKSMHPADFKIQSQMRSGQPQLPSASTILANQTSQQIENLNGTSKGKGMKNNQYLKLQIQNNGQQHDSNFNSLNNTNKNRPPSKRKVRSTTNTGIQQVQNSVPERPQSLTGLPSNLGNSAHKKHNSMVIHPDGFHSKEIPTKGMPSKHLGQYNTGSGGSLGIKHKIQTDSKIAPNRKVFTNDGISAEQTDISAIADLSSSPDKLVSLSSNQRKPATKKAPPSQRRQYSQERDISASEFVEQRKSQYVAANDNQIQKVSVQNLKKRSNAGTPLLDGEKSQQVFLERQAQMQQMKVQQLQQPNGNLMKLPQHLLMQDGGTGASMKRITFQPPDSAHTSNADSQSNHGGQYNIPKKQGQDGKPISSDKSKRANRPSSRQGKGLSEAQKAKQFNTTGVINKNEIFNAGGNPQGSRLPTKVPKQPKTQAPNFSINITEEALKQGKVPTEVVARNIALKKYNSKGLYGNSTKTQDNQTASPRVLEMIHLSQKIRQSFAKQNEAPKTNSEFYRAGKMLGRGAFGKVNLGMHKLTRKLVAVKSINKEYLAEEKQRNKVMHEVQILLKQRHDAVVKLYETFETSRHIMLVMELCAGGDLLNFVRKRKKLTEETAKVIFKQVIDGLGYIHSKNIIHRDIKLDNILLDGKGLVKIGDFGVSKSVQKNEIMREHSGTPAYIAPEIIKDKGYKGFKADLWSAGVVLFALLYGTVPFKANNMKELHAQIMTAKYNFKDTPVSEEAKDLIRGLLCVDPVERLGVSQVLKHKWMKGADQLSTDIFNAEEKEVIRSEFTYNDPSRYIRNEQINKDKEPWDCFTELNLDSMNCTLRNASTKSLILAPFNSSMSDVEEFFKESFKMAPMEHKKDLIKFAARCRDQDRQYEINNNAELDNGVYHKFVYSSKDSGEKDKEEADGENQLLSRNSSRAQIPKLDATKIGQMTEESEDLTKPEKKGKIKNEPGMQKQFAAEREALKAELRQQIRPGKQMTEEGSEAPKYDSSVNLDETNIDQDRVKILVDFGYPVEYINFSVQNNDANYCSAGYYMLAIDQNY